MVDVAVDVGIAIFLCGGNLCATPSAQEQMQMAKAREPRVKLLQYRALTWLMFV